MDSLVRDLAAAPERHPDLLSPGEVIGKFEVDRQLGRGGMGRVYLGHDRQLDRKVAIKLLRRDISRAPGVGERFLHEARITARLIHPHIVEVYDYGEHRGQPYLVLEHLAGEPLSARRRDGPSPPRAVLDLMLPVIGALAFAHDHDPPVVHRDLKPANVFLCDDGRIKVLDFGLASLSAAPGGEDARVDGVRGAEETRSVAGTPGYMAPEQIRGEVQDARVDVWAMGVMLHELLSGKRPYQELEGDRKAHSDAVSSVAPVPGLREVAPDLSRSLCGIVDRCLDKAPGERYQRAGELLEEVDEVRRQVDSGKETTRPPLWKQGIKVGLALCILTVVAAVAFLTLLGSDAEENATGPEKRRSERAEKVTKERQRKDRARRAGILLSRARKLVKDNQFDKALLVAANALQHQDDVQAREIVRLGLPRPRLIWSSHRGLGVGRIRFSPDGRYIAGTTEDGWMALWPSRGGSLWRALSTGSAVAPLAISLSPDGKHLASGHDDGAVRIWDLAHGEVVKRLAGHGSRVIAVAYAPDGETLASGGSDSTVRILRTNDGKEIRRVTLPGYAGCLAYSPDGKYLAAGGLASSIWLWEASSGKPLCRCKGRRVLASSLSFSIDGETLLSTGPGPADAALWNTRDCSARGGTKIPGTRAALFMPDGKRLISGLGDGMVVISELATGAIIRRFLAHRGAIASLACSPDGARLVTSGTDRSVHLWDLETGKRVAGLRGNAVYVESMAFSPGGARLATAGADRIIRLWRVERGEEIQEVARLKGHSDAVHALAFAADGKHLASASEDETVRLWELEGFKEVRRYMGHRNPVHFVSFKPGKGGLVSWGGDLAIRLWHTHTARQARSLSVPNMLPGGTALEPGGRLVAFGETGGGTALMDLTSGRVIRRLVGPDQDDRPVVFSPDGMLLATVGRDDTLDLWSVKSGELRGRLSAHDRRIRALAFTSDGRSLASGDAGGTVRIWYVEAHKEMAKLTGHRGAVTALAFSPDGSMLATGGDDNTLRVWGTGLAGKGKKFVGTGAAITAAVVSRGDRLIAASGQKGTVHLWDARTGKEQRRLRAHPGSRLAFSPDGTRLAVQLDGSTLNLVDLNTGRKTKKLGRPLPPKQRAAEILRTTRVSPKRGPAGPPYFGMNKALVDRLKARASATVRSLAFSPDGSHLATTWQGLIHGRSLAMWTLPDGQLAPWTSKTIPTWVFVSTDGWLIGAVIAGTKIQIIKAPVGNKKNGRKRRVMTLDCCGGLVRVVATSPDGRLLAAADGKVVRLFDLTKGRPRATLKAHEKDIYSLAVSDRGRFVASAGGDKAVIIWDATKGKELTRLAGHQRSITSLSFSPSASTLVSADGGGTVRLWDMRDVRRRHVSLPIREPVVFARDWTGFKMTGTGFQERHCLTMEPTMSKGEKRGRQKDCSEGPRWQVGHGNTRPRPPAKDGRASPGALAPGNR